MIGGKVMSFDAAEAKAMPGVIDVVQIPDGVAVVADTCWRANKAREALTVAVGRRPGAALNDASMLDGIRAAAGGGKPIADQGQRRRRRGDASGAAKVVSAEYVMPLLSHAPMEPMNFTADVRGRQGRCSSARPSSSRTPQASSRQALGMKPEDMTIETTFLGGGFGRRIDVDFIVQAAQISKAVGKPVKLLWTREDDMTHDFYRPMALHQLDGRPRRARQAGGDEVPADVAVGDAARLRAAARHARSVHGGGRGGAYEIAAMKHDLVDHDAGLRVGYWRSVSHALNAFANESFIDECAAAAGQDPLKYRLSLLAN